MTTQEKLIAKYGNPVIDRATFEKNWMILYNYPEDIRTAIPCLGKSVYINKDFVPRYIKFLRLLIQRGLHTEIHTNDEVSNIRMIRGTTDTLSIHSWAMAVDLNPGDNPLGETRLESINKGRKPFSEQFQQTARDAGLVPGIDFKRKDGMHYEDTKFL